MHRPHLATVHGPLIPKPATGRVGGAQSFPDLEHGRWVASLGGSSQPLDIGALGIDHQHRVPHDRPRDRAAGATERRRIRLRASHSDLLDNRRSGTPMAARGEESHTDFVEEVRTRSLVLPDVRGQERSLRITWHPATSTVVFSHWTGSVCTASTPVSLPEASRIIDLLVDGLRDAFSQASGGQVARQPETTRSARLLARLQPRTASIVELPRRLREEWRRRIAR